MAIDPIAVSFGGVVSDVAREQIPQGKTYRQFDWIPNNGAPARKRGPWEYASAAVNDRYVSGLGWFHALSTSIPDHLVAVTDGGVVYAFYALDESDEGIVVGTTSDGSPMTQKPVYWEGNLILPRANGGCYYYDGSSVSSGVSNYKVAAAWGEFLVFGNAGGSDANEVAWASGPASLISGSTASVGGEIVSIVGFPHLVMVFGYSDTWGIFGDDPPPSGDMSQRMLYSGNGCMDGRSVCATSSWVIWANTSGIYMANGGDPVDLTKRGGFSQRWRSLVNGFSLYQGWVATAGFGRGHYWITVWDNDNNLVTTALYDLDRQEWFEFQNISAACYAQRPGGIGTASSFSGSEELFFGLRGQSRVGRLMPCWDTQGPNDADGNAILPSIEFPFWTPGGVQSRFRRVFVAYDLSTSSDNTPSLELGFVVTPDETSYTTSDKLLGETSGREQRFSDVRRKADGVGLRLSQNAASDDTKLYRVDVEHHPLSGTR